MIMAANLLDVRNASQAHELLLQLDKREVKDVFYRCSLIRDVIILPACVRVEGSDERTRQTA